MDTPKFRYRDRKTGRFLSPAQAKALKRRPGGFGRKRVIKEPVIPPEQRGVLIRVGYAGRENSYAMVFEAAFLPGETEAELFDRLSEGAQAGEFDDNEFVSDLRWTSPNNYTVVERRAVAKGQTNLVGFERSEP